MKGTGYWVPCSGPSNICITVAIIAASQGYMASGHSPLLVLSPKDYHGQTPAFGNSFVICLIRNWSCFCSCLICYMQHTTPEGAPLTPDTPKCSIKSFHTHSRHYTTHATPTWTVASPSTNQPDTFTVQDSYLYTHKHTQNHISRTNYICCVVHLSKLECMFLAIVNQVLQYQKCSGIVQVHHAWKSTDGPQLYLW